MLAQRSPAVTKFVDQKALGRNGRYYIADIGFEGCNRVSAILRPTAKDLFRNEQATKRVWIRVAGYARQDGFLETVPPTLRGAGSENDLGVRVGLYNVAPVECRWPIHAGCVAFEDLL